MKTETLTFDNAKGAGSAYAALPDETDEKTKAVIIIQEYWGLNDHIKDIANRYADEGFIAIAPDLYQGKIAESSEEASKMMESLELEDGLDTIKNAITTAQDKYGIAKFGITGFCMGGTYALQAACKLEGLGAAAPFYGDVPDEFTLNGLKCPVIFISATKDKWINPEKVAELERIAKANILPIESVKYEADHAFFNDTRPEVYDAEAAKDAWTKVIAFFNENLKTVAPKLNEINTDDVF
ncbi:MAG: dienelactone hydrolase family protein [Acidobacteriota bacterium]|nr:dienelactone hydrolase family protein [Acidobacteriota bacterium]